jgi:hypothetical protein
LLSYLTCSPSQSKRTHVVACRNPWLLNSIGARYTILAESKRNPAYLRAILCNHSRGRARRFNDISLRGRAKLVEATVEEQCRYRVLCSNIQTDIFGTSAATVVAPACFISTKIWVARTLVNAGSSKGWCGFVYGVALGGVLLCFDWKFGTPVKGWVCCCRSCDPHHLLWTHRRKPVKIWKGIVFLLIQC